MNKNFVYHIIKLKHIKYCILFVLSIIWHTNVSGQNVYEYNNNWAFGDGNLFHFNDVSPTPITSVLPMGMSQTGACASISDGFGTLRFYVAYKPSDPANTMTLYGSNHVAMPNGQLMLQETASQGCIIVLDPENCQQYYVIYTDMMIGHGLRYSKVDMALNGGFGDVIVGQKDILLLNSRAEKVTLVQRGLTKYFNIITRQTATPLIVDSLVSIQLLPGGTFATPVVSGFAAPAGGGTSAFGHMQFQPTTDPVNKVLADVQYGQKEVNLYDYNSLTGVFTNRINIFNGSAIYTGGVWDTTLPGRAYGGCWSSGGQVFYCTFNEGATFNVVLRRYDFIAGPTGAVFTDSYLSSFGAQRVAIQRNLGGTIFMPDLEDNNPGSFSCDIINTPNLYLTPDMVLQGQSTPEYSNGGMNNQYWPWYNLLTPLDIVGPTQTICYNSSAVLGGTEPFNTDVTYAWQGQYQTSSGGWSPLSSSYLVNPTSSHPTTINLTHPTWRFIGSVLTTCGDTIYGDKTFVNLDSLSSPAITGNINYCAGQAITSLTATPALVGVINWYSNAGLTTLVGTGTTFTPSNTPGSTTYYVVEQEYVNMAPAICTGNVTQVVVTITSQIPIPIIYTPNSWYCVGDNSTPLNSSTGTVWYSDPGLTIQVGVGLNFTPTAIIGISSYYVIDTTGGCGSLSASRTVEFVNCPAYNCSTNLLSNGSFDNYSSCPTNTGQVANSTSWLGNGDYYNTICNGFYNSPVYYPYFNATNYLLGLSGGGVFPPPAGAGSAGFVLGGTIFKSFIIQQVTLNCSKEYTLQFRVTTPRSDTPPSNSLCVYGSNTPPPYAGCDPNLTLLNCLPSPGVVNNFWTPQSITFTPTQDYSYLVVTGQCPTVELHGGTVFLDDLFLCSTCVNPPNISSITQVNPATCVGNDGQGLVTATSCSTPLNYDWINNIAPSVVVSTLMNPNNLAQGNYTVNVTDNGNCISSGSVVISGTAPPTAGAGTDVTILSGGTTTLVGTGGGTYLWSTGATTSSINVSPTVTTDYCVTVTNASGCSDSACVRVNVDIICGELFVPTAFSPNNDDNNDVFRVKINPACVLEMQLLVFDRWGEKIIEITDPAKSWDGSFRGKQLDNAVFVYYLTITLKNSTEIIKKSGNVSLLK